MNIFGTWRIQIPLVWNPPTLPRLGQGRAAPGITVGVERCFLSKPPSTVPLPLTCFGVPKLTDASLRPQFPTPVPISNLPHAQELLGFSMVSAGTLSGFIGFRCGFMGFQNWRMAACPDLVGAGFSHAAAGALAGLIGFQNWRMAPGPDPKGFPKPKMSLELALAMLRLAPSLVLWDFKTDGWPPVPISKASPGPKCRWSWL